MSDDSFSFNPFPDPDVSRDRNGERVARIEHRSPGVDTSCQTSRTPVSRTVASARP